MADEIIAALTAIVASLQAPSASQVPTTPAPPGGPETRYCLRVDPAPDSLVATIQCRTRDDWASLDVDVDQEWAQNGVRTEG